MAKTRPLPELVYVARVIEDDASWLMANEDSAELVGEEDDPPVVVGTYELVGTRRLRKSVVIVDEEEGR